MAANLVARGLRRGDCVALLFVNRPEIVFSYYACFKAGLIAVPLNTRMKGLELAYVLNHAGTRALLGQEDLFRALEPIRADLVTLETCFLTGTVYGTDNAHSFESLLGAASLTSLPYIDAEQIAVIMYTSGTTARPKGVMHSHRSLDCLIGPYTTDFGGEELAVNAAIPPLAHMGSLGSVMLSTYRVGGAVLAIPAFDPVAVLQAIQKYRVTCFWMLPAMYAALMQVPDAASYDLSSVRVCQSGGDSMPAPIRERFQAMFGHEIVEVCGMTELIYSSNRPGNENRPGSIGKPLPGVRMRLVDDLGADVQRGTKWAKFWRRETR